MVTILCIALRRLQKALLSLAVMALLMNIHLTALLITCQMVLNFTMVIMECLTIRSRNHRLRLHRLVPLSLRTPSQVLEGVVEVLVLIVLLRRLLNPVH